MSSVWRSARNGCPRRQILVRSPSPRTFPTIRRPFGGFVMVNDFATVDRVPTTLRQVVQPTYRLANRVASIGPRCQHRPSHRHATVRPPSWANRAATVLDDLVERLVERLITVVQTVRASPPFDGPETMTVTIRGGSAHAAEIVSAHVSKKAGQCDKCRVRTGYTVDERAMPSRNAALAFSYRGKTEALTVSGAQSGWPELNGGCGSYSIPSWIA